MSKHSYFVWLLAVIVCVLAYLPISTPAADRSGANITAVFVDISQVHHDGASNGDTWDYIWADDDNIYSFNCDGRGYGKRNLNVSFNKLTGTQWDQLRGSSVNEMDYGAAGERCPNGSNWKVTGAESIDGAIYAFIANNWYGDQNAYGGSALDPHMRQTVSNMSLIKSRDKGLTWTRDSRTNYEHPMWTNKKFSTAYFFKYGKDGGATRQDDQDKYVYAISNDGAWDCGSRFSLGRVPRSKIGDLNPADWEYLSNGRWSHNLDDAIPVPGFPNGPLKCTTGSPIWLARLHKYVTVTWFNPDNVVKWYYPENVTFVFYQADHPWGPWAYIGEISGNDFLGDTKDRITRWYGPSLSPKFITENADGSVTAVLTFSGQLWDDKPSGLYKNNACPVTFSTTPQPKEVQTYNDTEGKYSPNWRYEQGRKVGDYQDDVHVTTSQNDYVDFNFNGRGIEVLCEKSSEMGKVEVLIDGTSRGTFSLYQDPMPLLYQVPVFRDMKLKDGAHTLRVINKASSGTVCTIDGFRVYSGTDFDPKASYMLVNRVNGKALDGADWPRLLQIVDEPGLRWKLQPDGAGYYRILNHSGRLLGADANDLEGAPLGLYSQAEDENANLRWKILPAGKASFALVNCANGLAAGGEAGDSASQSAYFGRDSQKWEIVKVR